MATNNQQNILRTLAVSYYPDGRHHLPGASALISWSDDYQEVLESSKIALKRYTPRPAEVQKWWLSTPEDDDSNRPAEVSPSAFAAVVQGERVKLFLCGGLLSPDLILYPVGCHLVSEKHYSFNIVAIGDISVDKTMLLRHFLEGRAVQTSPTNGPLTCTTERFLAIPGGEKVKLILQDTVGQERFMSLAPSIFRNVSGVFLVFDLTKRESLPKCKSWLATARESTNVQIPVLLIGNKSDRVDEREVGPQEVEAFMSENNVFDVVETSSTTGFNVEEAYQKLIQKMFDQYRAEQTLSNCLGSQNIARNDVVHIGRGTPNGPEQMRQGADGNKCGC